MAQILSPGFIFWHMWFDRSLYWHNIWRNVSFESGLKWINIWRIDKWIQILALFIFCYDLGSQRCLTVTNLSKTIIWIQNSHQVDLTKSNLLKWTTLILKSVCIFQRSQRGKRGFVIHLVGFTFFLFVEHVLAIFFATKWLLWHLAFTWRIPWNFCYIKSLKINQIL